MIEISDLIVQFVFSFLVLLSIYLINKSDVNFTYKLFFSTVVLLESTTSFLFFSNKFSKFLSLILFFASINSIKNLNSIKNSSKYIDYDKDFGLLTSQFTNIFRGLGSSIIFIVILLEFAIFDGYFSPFTFFSIGIGIVVGIYGDIPKAYLNEKRFLLIFSLMLFIMAILPAQINKLGWFEEKGAFWYSSPELVAFYLAEPLVKAFNLLGYPFHSKLDIIYFQDKTLGITQGVLVGEGCSGLHSISIFICAFISYVITFYKRFDLSTSVLLFLGIMIAYVANFIRMGVTILAGHYYGMDALSWVHQNAGTFIFMFWILIFWYFMDKFYALESNRA